MNDRPTLSGKNDPRSPNAMLFVILFTTKSKPITESRGPDHCIVAMRCLVRILMTEHKSLRFVRIVYVTSVHPPRLNGTIIASASVLIKCSISVCFPHSHQNGHNCKQKRHTYEKCACQRHTVALARACAVH